jgi:hypothetical protein
VRLEASPRSLPALSGRTDLPDLLSRLHFLTHFQSRRCLEVSVVQQVAAPEGTPIHSITDGTVVMARSSRENGWNSLGGYTVMVEAAYDAGPLRREHVRPLVLALYACLSPIVRKGPFVSLG